MSRVVTVIGGSGFIGRYVVEQLGVRGDQIRIATRHPNEAIFLKTLGDVGQIQTIGCNIIHRYTVARAVRGADVVINLVGVLYNSGSQTFQALQAEGAGIIAEEAAKAGVKSLVHLSAIGASAMSDSVYAQTKAEGEARVKAAFSKATILRPSLVIGVEDGFFNRFAKMANQLPFLMVPGLESRFQPVTVNDVADAVLRAAEGGEQVEGQTFELGGPEVMTFRALLERMMGHTGVKRPLINMPFGLASVMGTFANLLPNPPITADQVELLKTDNIVADGAKTLADMGLTAHGFDAMLPRYLVQYKERGQFG